MTAAQRVARTQVALAATVAVVAVLWAIGSAVALIAAIAAVDVAFALPRGVRQAVMPLGILLGGFAFVASVWRRRRVVSPPAVALWIEERKPALHYALVSILDPRSGHHLESLENTVRRVAWIDAVARAALRGVAAPLPLLAFASVLTLLMPTGVVRRVVAPRPGDVLDQRGTTGDALSPRQSIVVSVTMPNYAGGGTRVLEDPLTVPGLVGSRVRVEGGGSRAAVRARLGVAPIPVGSAAGRWWCSFLMPSSPAVLHLEAGDGERTVGIEPVPDSLPIVTLAAPDRDTVFREATGTLALTARAQDDFGLEDLQFEYILSSGSGESFAFRSGVLGRSKGGGRAAVLQRELVLDSLGLGPGDVVHLRAVAHDRNDVTGPGVGASETRMLRVARAGEYDSVTMAALPPVEADTSFLSQRLLIVLAEALERRRPRLDRVTVVSESQAIGRDQTRLRRRVAEVIFLRLGGETGEHAHGEREGDVRREQLSPAALLRAAEAATATAGEEALDFHDDETPVVAVNRPLLEAYDAMWDAGRELDIGEPGRALPHMRLALEAIQRARQAERIYLRGRPATIVVDLARVRLAGDRDTARPAMRSARAPTRTDRGALSQRFRQAARAVRTDPSTIDSLLVLRIDALEGFPAFARALREAIELLRGGHAASEALLRARDAIEYPSAERDSLALWTIHE